MMKDRGLLQLNVGSKQHWGPGIPHIYEVLTWLEARERKDVQKKATLLSALPPDHLDPYIITSQYVIQKQLAMDSNPIVNC